MKLPKIDLSKEGLKRFTLYHIEKVILLLALAGFGVFFWLGFKTETFAETDPEQLSRKADAARQYMVSPSWEAIEAKRIIRDKADGIVKNTKKLDSSGYKLRSILGTPRQSLGLRKDPEIEIIDPYDFEVDVVTAPVLYLQNGGLSGTYQKLDKLSAEGPPETDDRNKRRKNDEGPKVGDSVSELLELVGRGVRTGRSTNSVKDFSLVKPIVAIKALIKHKEFWTNVEKNLKNTYGYFPERDRPNYKLLQVQRKEGNGAWKDRTVLKKQFEKLYSAFAPEVVAPANYDLALTGIVPPIPLLDYRSFVTHSQVAFRSFDKADKSGGGDKTEVVNAGNPDATPDDSFDNPFGQPNDSGDSEDGFEGDMEMGPVRAGSDTSAYVEIDKEGPSGQYKVVRFFDLWDVKPGRKYTYRFRIWTDDPNHEEPKRKAGQGGGKKGGGSDRNDRDPGNISGLGSGGGGGGGQAGLTDEGGGRGGGPPSGRGGGGPPGTRGGGGPPGGRGRGGKGADQAPEYKKIPIPEDQKDISVRNRIDNHLSDIDNDVNGIQEFIADIQEQFDVDLTYCRPGNWVEVSVTIPKAGNAEVFVGEVVGRQTRSPRREPVTVGDKIARVLVSEWSSRLGTLVSKFRSVRKGDWLSFDVKDTMNVLHIVDNAMLKLFAEEEGDSAYKFRADQFVVDLMGGEKIDAGRTPVEYRVPGEMLLMDEAGNVVVRNALEEKREYLLRSQSSDESSEYNLKKRSTTRGGRGGDR